jgi:diguanylate cyclase (GGDEF)-like protein/PAS domain S-box-containing protein
MTTTDFAIGGLRDLIDRTVDGVLVLDPAGAIRYANDAAGRMLGGESASLVGEVFGLPFDPDSAVELDLFVSGEPRSVVLHTELVRWGEAPAVLAVLRDGLATEAESAARELNRTLVAVISAAPVGIIRIDPDGRVLSWNPAAEAIFGWSSVEVLGRPAPFSIRLDVATGLDQRVIRRDGSVVVSVSVAEVNGDDGGLEAVVVVVSDVTERYVREEEVRRIATHDQLTGLLNRRAFEDAVDRVIERMRREPGSSCGRALLLLDLDRFKAVNDTAGHLAGDQMLIGVARALEQMVRPGEALARFGGDEFAVLLGDVDLAGARAAAERLRQRTEAFSLTIAGQRYDTTLTIGGALIDGRLDSTEVMAVADVALHNAKRARRNSVLIYEEAVAKALELADSARRAQAVRRALDADAFVVDLQPIVSLAGEEVGCEALIRLSDDDRVRLPIEFLPLAESMGLIWEIDLWMTRSAIRRLADPAHPPVWVNLSRATLGDSEVLAVVQAAPPAVARRLGFEISEAALADDFAASSAWISELRHGGCRFAIDDFGTQSTTFSALRHLNIDVVKVDRHLAAGLAVDQTDRRVVRSITELCHALELTVVLEGVENAATLDVARELKIDCVQGYLWPSRRQPVGLAG